MTYADKVARIIEGSALWKELNEKAKELYEKHGRTPSEEEYQALRKVLVDKVILDDPEVFKAVADLTFEETYKAS